ncbi:type VI secretion system tip protein TssI/VgrG [Thalassomonas sp. RHCl1]|uniref:type VI secretion system Vgr family protein n=1 Tax=Thalassomonas sp. RHCl1 TaxID=2995320 RepID=UPI00248D1A36|nr:type VI secretion system tip protein TssI/VgrG [Thalassomonas sp. RHCl1]
MKTHLQLKDSKGNSYNAYNMRYSSVMSQGYQLQVELEFDQEENLEKARELLGEFVSCQLFAKSDCQGEPLFSRSGLVQQLSQLPFSHNRLQLIAVPFMTLLHHSNRFRVFQNKSTADIVKSILDETGFSSCFKMGKMPSSKREFCLQFDESDGDFVKRLLAEEGIHFFDQQLKENYQLHFHDASLPFKREQIIKLASDNKPDISRARLSDWQQQLQFHGQQLQLGSWDDSKGKWVASKVLNSSFANGSSKGLMHYHYPAAMVGEACDSSAANALVKKRLLQNQSNYQSFTGTTDSYEIALGQTIDVKDQGLFLVTGVEESFAIDDNNGGVYQCRFDCIPEGQSFFPEFIPKPQLNALQSALVVGSNKAKPNQDAQGRVRVKFHWDNSDGDKTSCWLRVAQLMAGKNYGMQFIPREGQEVLVNFLGGDPDKPVITGCVYNQQQPVPDAKANSTVSTIRTQLDGKANEIALDDKKDAEKLSLNAGRDFELTVGNDALTTVTGESKSTISKKFTLVLEDDADIKISKKADTQSKSYSVTAEDELKLVVGDNQLIINKDGIELKAKKIELSADKALKTKAESIALEAKKNLSAKGKNITQKASGKLTMNSTQAMLLDSKNKITLASVQDLGLSAKAGQFKGEGKMGMSLKGLKIDIAGQAMANVKAPLVKIN